ncbi:MAG: T9SS type A sorting domain-containing protein, partial [Bacteroidales bacterium]|nr:T9SS type A sorting domain-containing protein [Bacteroidales bacterium]
IQLDHSGNASIAPADVDNGSWDACGIAGMTVEPNTFTCAEYGDNTVVLTVTDIHGNVSSCESTVTVEDLVPADAICKNITIQLDHSGNASIVPADVDNGSWDACGIAGMTVEPNTFICENVGDNTVILTVTDIHGNNSTCEALVKVEDNIIPTFTRPDDITIYTDSNCDYDISVGNVGDVTNEWDNCETPQAVYTDVIADGPCEGTYIITRTWSLTDVNYNAAADQVQIITVLDNTAPTFTAPADITITADDYNNFDVSPENTGDVVDEWDNCSTGIDATYVDSQITGSCYGSRVITRTWSLVDNCGNAAVDQVQTIVVAQGYVILVKDRAEFKRTTVHSGGVGVKKVKDGKIEAREYTTIAGASTFGKAKTIHTDATSTIETKFLAPANVPWPVFEPMPYTGSLTVHVPNNTTVYLTDTLYKEVKVGKNATAVFTQPVVNIERKMQLEDGATVKFLQCGKVRLKDKFECRKNVNINPDNVSVKWYIDHDVTFKEGAHVNGFFFLGDTGNDTARHRLIIEDSKLTNPAVFTGMYVARSARVGKYTNFYLNIDCNNCPPVEDPGIFECPEDIIVCNDDSVFNLLSMIPPHTGVLSVTNNQPAKFPVGTTQVTWRVIYPNGYIGYCKQNVTRSGPLSIEIVSSDPFCDGDQIQLSAVISGNYVEPVLWSTDETDAIIYTNTSGIYSVEVTNVLGCSAYADLELNLEANTWLSSYTMIARDKIEIRNTTVNSGGLGVFKLNDGKIEVKEASLVVEDGTFAMADVINVDGSSSVATKYNSPAQVILPVFEENTNVSNLNLNIPDNTPGIVEINGTSYKDVIIGKNNEVIFTAPEVNISGKLQLKENSVTHFSQCTKMRIKGVVESEKNITLNPEELGVVFYVEDNVTFRPGAYVTGMFYLGRITGIDYVFKAEDSRTTRAGVYKGVFIAKEIQSMQNNYWYLNPTCGSCTFEKESETNTDNLTLQNVNIRNYPNPFSDITNIVFTLPFSSKVSLDVYDISGKKLTTLFNGNSEEGREYRVEFDGTSLSPGVYFYRLTTEQGVYNGKMIFDRQ